MHPNPGDCDAAVARYCDLLLDAERERRVRALGTATRPSRERRRLGALLIRVGRRLEGAERSPLIATPVAGGSAATRV